eukprot:Em0021g639a
MVMEIFLRLAVVFFAAFCSAAGSKHVYHTPERRSTGASFGATYFVDGQYGNDSNAGTLQAPFLTLTKARDTIRSLKSSLGGSLPAGGVLVQVRGRDYPFLSAPFTLTQQDSGTAQSPIVYQSYPGDAPAHLLAGAYVTPNMYTPVTDQSVLNLIGNGTSVVQVNLKQLGILTYGDLATGSLGNCNNNKLELFYPNRVEISQWKNTSTLWLHGFWSYDWADNYVKVVSVNTTLSAFVINNVTTPPLYGFLSSARYYALNILEELDAVNEYYVDRGSGILYIYSPPQDKGCVSVGSSVISMTGVSYVSFVGFTMDCSRGTAVSASSAVNVTFSNCTIGSNGGSSLSISGYNNTLERLEVSGNGCGGISVSGGNQLSLTPGFNTLKDSSIHDWSRWKRTYQPGLSWSGVGNSFINNTIYNGPHSGILGKGNDCIFSGNVLRDLCYEVTDSGAFYSGRSWISGGNIVANNVFMNIITTEKVYLGSPSVQAIYLDDQMSGFEVINNTFINCYAGTFIGGGRSNVVTGNVYVNCTTAVHIDNRGLTWQPTYCSTGGMFSQQLQSVNYTQPPWSLHYPQLVNITTDHPCVPCYNLISGNIYCRVKQFVDFNSTIATVQWLANIFNNTQDCSVLNPPTSLTTASSASSPTTASSTSSPTTASSASSPTTASSASSPTTASSASSPTTESSASSPTTASSASSPTTASSASSPTTASSASSPTTESSASSPTTASSAFSPTTASSASSPTTESSASSPTTSSSASSPTTASSASSSTTENSASSPTTENSASSSTSESSTSNPLTGAYNPTTVSSNLSSGTREECAWLVSVVMGVCLSFIMTAVFNGL